MSNILAIETTGKISSAALLTSDGQIFTARSEDEMNHLRDLIPMIDSIMFEAKLNKNEPDVIAVSAGPGSFTGIRIGMSTAKALAQALDIPAAAVPTLAAFSFAEGITKDALICPMMDARRERIYAGAFISDSAKHTLDAPDASSVDKATECKESGISGILQKLDADVYEVTAFVENAVLAAIQLSIEKIVFCGDGAEKYKEYVDIASEKFTGKVEVLKADGRTVCQDAVFIAEAAAKGVKLVNYSELEAIYLQRPEAERKLKANQLGLKKKISDNEEEIKELPSEDEKITYRIANLEDIAALSDLDKVCFERSWSKASYEEELCGKKDSLYAVAENEVGEIIGLAGIIYIAGEGEIDRVAVNPLYRARGVGSHMIDILLEDAKKRAVSDITLEVREANRSAIVMYKKHGFNVEGKRQGYYSETGENALIMWRREKRGDE